MNTYLLNLIFLALFSIPVFYFDIRYKKIPNILSIGTWFLYLILIFLLQNQSPSLFILASLISFLSYLVIYFISRRKLGMGDAKLALLLGGIGGVSGWYFTNLFATLLALIFYLILKFQGKADRTTKIPFGPFLCTGSILNQCLTGSFFL